MKLFIWADPYQVNYGGSLLLAVANTMEEAKTEAAKGIIYMYGKYKEEHKSLTEVVSRLGEPSRILELPYAEWQEWSE